MFLKKIVETTEIRIEKQKRFKSLTQIRKEAWEKDPYTGFAFKKVLNGEGISFICEVKKASPSKGIIAESFPYLQIAKEYEAAGAAAISVLTEPDFFMGANGYLQEISAAVSIPTLRKDFVIDPYQIYEAKILGAGAILLISEILDEKVLKDYLELTRSLGMSALVESHSLPLLEKALRAGADIIGVNNRNLETFEVDISTSAKLRAYVPADCLFVSESGIRNAEDIRRLRESKVDAVLIGETLMKSADKKKELQQLKGDYEYKD